MSNSTWQGNKTSTVLVAVGSELTVASIFQIVASVYALLVSHFKCKIKGEYLSCPSQPTAHDLEIFKKKL